MSREIMTYSGKMFDFWKPTIESICIKDIAHALSLTNRYGGHTIVPYSVAEHSVRMSHIEGVDALACLLHDAAEAYIGDIPSPQKEGLKWVFSPYYEEGCLMRYYKNVEYEITLAIYEALNVLESYNGPFSEGVKKADKIMLATEIRDLMPPHAATVFVSYLENVEPLMTRIIPWSWQTAQARFLHRFEELTHGKSTNE